jgi:hypothetical protein
MPTGLQCFNDAGQLVFDTNDRVGRIVGALYTGGVSGSQYVDELASGQGFAICYPAGAFPGNDVPTSLPTVWVSGGTIYWQYAAWASAAGIANMNCRINYGVC